MNRLTVFFIALLFSFSITAQVWEELGEVPFPGLHHGVGFSFDGFGYVITGSENGFTQMVWKYDPSTDEWEQLADYPGPMRGYSIGDFHEGKGYFGFGYGVGGPLDDLWVFDPSDGSFEELANCPCEPRAHPAMVTFEDKIYMGMGSGNEGNLGDWYEYDISTDSWTQKADFIGADRHHPYQFVIDDYVYIGSGHQADWYRYEPAADEWMQIATHPGDIRVAGAQFSFDGKGYVLSGLRDYDDYDHAPMVTGEFWEYDPEADSWTELPPHPGWSRWAPASFIIDDWVYIIAGEGGPPAELVFRYHLGESAVSTSENEDELGVTLSPMPVVDHLIIGSEKRIGAVKIHDLNGQLLWQAGLIGRSIDLSDLPPGMYIIELIGEEGASRQRIIKE